MVYVDNAFLPFHQMRMCHMSADTLDELHTMADSIGLRREWFQGDHYDVALRRRNLAVKAGAKEITTREMVAVVFCLYRNPQRLQQQELFSGGMH
jgi:hypothetical protein